jgi:hypothetical protein
MIQASDTAAQCQTVCGLADWARDKAAQTGCGSDRRDSAARDFRRAAHSQTFGWLAHHANALHQVFLRYVFRHIFYNRAVRKPNVH